jgi:hypothetical protein
VGRELRRVALDFDWELNKVWKGFINPYYKLAKKCECENGYSPYGSYLQNLWYGYVEFKPESTGSTPFSLKDQIIQQFAQRNVERAPEYYGKGKQVVYREAVRLCRLFNNQWCHHLSEDDVAALLKAGRLMEFKNRPLKPITEDDIRTHAYYLWVEAGCPECDGKEFWEESVEKHERYWLPYDNGYVPTAKEVNDWSIQGFGHDGINCWICIKAKAKRDGKTAICELCDGEGEFWEEKDRKLFDEWEPENPPEGEGYQLWETVSEGSPVSPVFENPEDLANWLVDTNHYDDCDFEQWMKFIIGPGWAPSLIGSSSGVAGIVALN